MPTLPPHELTHNHATADFSALKVIRLKDVHLPLGDGLILVALVDVDLGAFDVSVPDNAIVRCPDGGYMVLPYTFVTDADGAVVYGEIGFPLYRKTIEFHSYAANEAYARAVIRDWRRFELEDLMRQVPPSGSA